MKVKILSLAVIVAALTLTLTGCEGMGGCDKNDDPRPKGGCSGSHGSGATNNTTNTTNTTNTATSGGHI